MSPPLRAGILRRLTIVFALSLLLTAVLDNFNLFEVEQWFEGLQGEALADRVTLVLRLLFLPFLPIGLYMLYLGYRILAAGRFPPEGMWLIGQRKIETGMPALARGWLAIISGILLGLIAWYGAVVVPQELGRELLRPPPWTTPPPANAPAPA